MHHKNGVIEFKLLNIKGWNVKNVKETLLIRWRAAAVQNKH
jgi:hypothetical protein